MFEKMLNNKRIKIQLNTDYFKKRNKFKYKYFLIYRPDRYFNYKYGK